jgi:phenylacetate-coenzyme A ligase PaaK-like adenylate-forming protein
MRIAVTMQLFWAGAGNQTASLAQVDLVHDLGATVWCGMPSFGLHIAHLAEAAGRPVDRSAVHTLVTTAEALSRPKRAVLERLWGARVRRVRHERGHADGGGVRSPTGAPRMEGSQLL